METELGLRIHPAGAGDGGHSLVAASRRRQHQQKLKALIAALDDGDLIESKVCYRLLLEFSPALAQSSFVQVGTALDRADLAQARRVIEEIYGQSQAIFKRPARAPSLGNGQHGVLIDCSA